MTPGQKTLHEKPLLLGEYVEVIIQGELLKAVTAFHAKLYAKAIQCGSIKRGLLPLNL